ncbi:hypothetical protein [Rhizobium phaseoli]|nr:hypothetical protein [Rhizobium phaseoli]
MNQLATRASIAEIVRCCGGKQQMHEAVATLKVAAPAVHSRY